MNPLNGGQAIKLAEDSAETFGLYLDVLFTNEVVIYDSDAPEQGFITEDHIMLSKACVLADKVGDTITVNLLIDEILHRFRRGLEFAARMATANHIRYVYENTPTGSRLRGVLVGAFVGMYKSPPSTLMMEEEWMDIIPKTFLRDLIVFLLSRNHDDTCPFVTHLGPTTVALKTRERVGSSLPLS
ncbi:hypothetical protein LTR62_001309 [Meristemomyces frigidus]|uniref:Uncharacterized protein n=1 Tax=Meristemomyces frigidus TaxID=1508187 RepID=A0AAN7TBL9_9PEZI|nr:hypothetical protein LTR62_001309 [Meristemomyces frigidus]